MSIVLLIISIILYYNSLTDYSVLFCWLCLCIFFLNTFLLIRKSFIKQPVSFNTFFLLSFFLVSYAYPVFIMPSGLSPLFDSSGMINPQTINACTALCTIAISSYTFGYMLIFKNKNQSTIDKNEIKVIAKKIKFPYWISLVMVFVVLYYFFKTIHDVDIEVQTAPFLFIIFLILTIVLLVSQTLCIPRTGSLSLRSFISTNKHVLFASATVMMIYAIIGDRLLILELGLIILSVYSLYFKNIRLRHFLCIIMFGVVFMTLLMWTRGGEASLRNGGTEAFFAESERMYDNNEAGIWGLTSDLSGRFQELSYGYDLTKKKGHTYAMKIIPAIFSPIPFVPNIISELIVGVPTSMTSAGSQIARDSGHNVGSHCVIDIFMPWGLPGIIIFFSLFGLLVSYITKNVNRSIYFNVIYIVLIYQSVFITRGTIFDVYRSLVWALLIVYWAKRSSKRSFPKHCLSNNSLDLR